MPEQILGLDIGGTWLQSVRGHFAGEVHPNALPRTTLAPSRLGARLQDLSALVIAPE